MAKVVLGRAVGVLPALEHVLDKIAKKQPQYEFVALNYVKKLSADGESKETWVNKVTVYDGPDIIGHLSYGEHQGKQDKNGNYPDAFGISSHKIRKERGERDTLITADPSAAVRQALKLLGKKSRTQITVDILNEISSGISSISYNATYALREMISFNQDEIVLIYVEHLLLGVPLKVPSYMRFDKTKKINYENYIAAKQINEAMGDRRNDRGYAVSFLRDDSVRVVNVREYRTESSNKVIETENSKCMVHYKGFDELPKHIQDRVAVLKIAECREPVFNMGVRVSSDEDKLATFYILDESDIREHPYENSTQV